MEQAGVTVAGTLACTGPLTAANIAGSTTIAQDLTVSGAAVTQSANSAIITIKDTANSATGAGGKLILSSHPSTAAAMADTHRLGVIEFKGTEDTSNTLSIGAKIEAVCNDAWDGTNNDGILKFYTTNGTTESAVLTLGNDQLATFSGAVTVSQLATLNGNVTISGAAVTQSASSAITTIKDTATSAATAGGKLILSSDDGAVMADTHRLGVIEFKGAEDASNTLSIGAKIEAVCNDAWDGTNNDGILKFYTTNGITESAVLTLGNDQSATFSGAVTVSQLATLNGNVTISGAAVTQSASSAITTIKDTATSAATAGGKLILSSDDGAVMADTHRLGVIEFKGAEDTSNTLSIGAKIEAVCNDAWDGTNNDGILKFYTTNGTTESAVLTLGNDQLATFSGAVTVSQLATLNGNVTISGAAVTQSASSAITTIKDTATSAATAGGKLILSSDDGAVMADTHRLGVIEFKGTEDTSNTLSIGAKIEAVCNDAWDGTNNDGILKFYTTDGTTETAVLTLGNDQLATFSGAVTVSQLATLNGNVTISGAAVTQSASSAITTIKDTATSAATAGGKLILSSDDGAVMADTHRLGVIEFKGAEDTSNTLSIGAKIEAVCNDAWDGTNNDGILKFYTTNGTTESAVLTLGNDQSATFSGAVTVSQLATLNGNVTISGVAVTQSASSAITTIKDTATSAATAGGKLILSSDDGAVMADTHRLGVIEFKGAEDASNTLSIGAKIEAVCNDAWDGTNNDGILKFYTTNGTTESAVLTLGNDQLATFSGAVTVSQLATLNGNVTISGAAVTQSASSAITTIKDTATSAATAGGKLILSSDDGAVMADTHRLGVIEFKGAEDASNTLSIGAKIEAVCNDAWDGTNNDGILKFYTTDGITETAVLTLGNDQSATFSGAVTVSQLATLSGNVTISGAAVTQSASSAITTIKDTANSATGAGGKLILSSHPSTAAAMADTHRLGVIEFKGTEDTSNTLSIGAKIEAVCNDAWDGTNNDGILKFYTTDGTTETAVLTLGNDQLATLSGNVTISGAAVTQSASSAITTIKDTAASAATAGGKLILSSDDGAVMADTHRLGVIEFKGAEDASNTLSIGAKIEAVCNDAWDGTNNDGILKFYTTNGITESAVLTLGNDQSATFSGAVTVSQLATLNGNVTISGAAVTQSASSAITTIKDTATSAATAGGKLILSSDDGAVMADTHRLGVIEFKGAEDASNTLSIGAKIEAVCNDAWGRNK